MKLAQCIDKLATKHGGLRSAARAAGLDAGYLSRLRSGQKEHPSEQVLAALGLERVLSYRMSKKPPQPFDVAQTSATHDDEGALD